MARQSQIHRRRHPEGWASSGRSVVALDLHRRSLAVAASCIVRLPGLRAGIRRIRFVRRIRCLAEGWLR